MTDDATLRTLLAAAIHEHGGRYGGSCPNAGDEWGPGTYDTAEESADHILDTPSGRALLDRAGEAERLREALWDARAALVAEHGHDGDAYAPWPSCLPVHIALNRARAALRQPTHPEAGG